MTDNEARVLFNKHAIYHNFEVCDDYMMIMLVSLDKAVNISQEIVNIISADKKLYRQNIKRLCKYICNPSGTSYTRTSADYRGLSSEMTRKLMSNLTSDSSLLLADIVDEMDSIVDKDIYKMYNAVKIEVGKKRTSNPDLVSRLVAMEMSLTIMRNVYERITEIANPYVYALCTNPQELESRKKAMMLVCDDVKLLENRCIELVALACAAVSEESIDLPTTLPIKNGIETIAMKMVDVRSIYKACDKVGYDLRKNSSPDTWPETIDAKLKEKAASVKPTEKRKPTTVQQLAEKQGWTIK